MNKNGFTLSEVLITLTVIGVVSIMTIPSFVKNYNKHIYSSKISKTYAQINEAVKTIMADEETDKFTETKAIVAICDDDGKNCKEDSTYFLDNYFKIMKRGCGVGSCLASKYVNLKGDIVYTISPQYCIQTVEGVAICSKVFKPAPGYKYLQLEVDTTGKDGPNVYGYDLFDLIVDETVKKDSAGNVTSVNVKVDDFYSDPNCDASQSSKGACVRRLMSNGWKIDY